ncbi:site-specific DNA-methyltransferase [Desulfovibrio cuneatus]|uniref:site-specific DNA-methyltransferase n=1 Tax=Desulfovibrio cuneatus TaxID=159728 RepID=UPI0004253C25|nr:site-specific DNA-methyltransferase [Desulfovibrio cuneatus]
MAKKIAAPTPVTSLRHQDSRVNIPTEELRDFVQDDENSPKAMRYPRDVSLDPQLVWKGKDEQDAADLNVPVVPIYIQEKIHPQAIIDDMPRKAKHSADQLTLFADFNGLPKEFDQRVDFYNHQGHWQNRMILGDSLLVMNSLAEKEGLKGQVQCIYLDPPYGIKFGSNWQVSTRKRDVKDGKAEDVTRQPEQVRAFRDTWELGIHSYLAYLRDRLVVARELLTESGSVFVQIGDENVHLVRCLLDEVFGAENFVAQISFQKTGGIEASYLSSTVDYVLWAGKNKAHLKYRSLYSERNVGDTSLDRYDMLLNTCNENRRLTKEEMLTGKIPAGTKRYQLAPLYSDGASSEIQAFEFQGKKYIPRGDTHWKTTIPGLERLAVANRIEVMGTVIRYRRFADDFPVIPIGDRWDSMQIGVQRTYVVQTATSVIQRCLLMSTDPGDLVLDPTCGSGTSAYVAEQWGRRWITCDTSRVALALARTRLMGASFPYYLLADSPEGEQKAAELENRPTSQEALRGDIRKGFVYKRVPHITLKSIANNPDISKGMSQEALDAAILRHAKTETLFDQPYENKKAVRVAGPFTVESLSPHRVLAVADANLDGTVTEQEAKKQQDFASMILENLNKAGVQNTNKAERLKFDRMEPFAGKYIQAIGHYTDKEGKNRRAAISIGPEHGTVGSVLVKEAAKEAVLGIGFDLLIVCGFAFDPSVSEEAKRYGNLTVLPARMNPDLAMGDDLLKKTGAGNLFMVFGEPDVLVHPQKDGQIVVEIKGLDIYDPTTGEVRSNSTKDIACWFIDTQYNGESFFVRHAYFTGEGEPYARLKRALKAEIDEAAWASLYCTQSRPFPKPETGKIAVKVINHYGDEVMQVFGV